MPGIDFLICSIDGGADSTPKLPDFSPFYPHHKLASDSSAECLKTILSRYYDKSDRTSPSPVHTPTPLQATPPSVSATLPVSAEQPPSPNPSPSKAVATPTLSHRTSQRTTPQAKKTARSVRATKKKATAASEQLAKSEVLSPKRNHVRKITSKFSLPSLLSKSSRVSKAASKKASIAKAVISTTKKSADDLRASKVIEQLRLNSHHHRKTKPEFLTLLPPRTPYQSLLMALSQASKGNKGKDTPPPASPPKQQRNSPSSSTRHTHSVFHDHFALLGIHHIPSEFCCPITSLSLQLPIDVYTSCVRARVTREEHSYAKAPEMLPAKSCSQKLNLKLSLPRSLLQSNETMSPCGCDRGALVFCSCCHSLYHSTCSGGTLCTKCLTLKSLNLS